MSTSKKMVYNWNNIPWRKLEKSVFKLQKRIYQASCEDDKKAVHKLQRLLVHSRSAVLLSVKRVAQENQGKRTAGVDGLASIPAGMNPVFSGDVTITGVVYIETPNVVTFTGGTSVTGIVVGNGNPNDDSGTNQIIFRGNVSSRSVIELSGEYGELNTETGTFMMAPGFKASFGGSFDTLNGAIAANGVEFFGNAGGIINGSIVNYANVLMTLSGNSDLQFNRSGITQIPSGFGPEIVIHAIPASYAEVY